MKLIQILLTSIFTIAAAGTFAAKAEKPQKEEKVVVSTQEQPATATENAVAKPASAQPTEETAAEKTPAVKPAQ